MNLLRYKSESFLKKVFDDFVLEVVELKRNVGNSQWQRDNSIRNAGDFVIYGQKQLRSFIENFGISARNNNIGMEVINEVKYIMVSLCDEIFLHIDWDGKEIWEQKLLESALFDSHVSGIRFFENLENLFISHDPNKYDLAYIYLNCLGLGFLGKFRSHEDQGDIKFYKRKLYHLIYDRDPIIEDKEFKLNEEPYQHTVDHNNKYKLIDFGAWYAAFALVAFTLFVLSDIVWRQHTNTISEISKSIVETQESQRGSAD